MPNQLPALRKAVSITLPKAVADQIARRIEKGVPLQTAIKAAGVGDATVRLWQAIVQNDPRLLNGLVVDEPTRQWVHDFVARIDQAQAVLEADLVEGITEAAGTV